MRIGLISGFVLVLAAACGDDDSSPTNTNAGAGGHAGSAVGAGGAAGQGSADCTATVSLLDYKLNPSSLDLKSGSVTLCATNDGKAPHDLAIRDSDSKKLGITTTLAPGETGHFTVDLKAGDYTMYCSQAGHESLGMKGPVVVK